MSIAVVICAYTEARWPALAAAVASVEQQTTPPAEVIVVIDHNPPLAARARARFAQAVVLENQEPRGLSGARNAGLRAARADIVAFLDDDALADPAWLHHLAAGYTDAAVLGTGGTIEPVWPGQRPAWFPPEFDWVVGCTYRGLPVATAPVRNLIGANMSLRREVLGRVGGFRIGRVGKLTVGQEDDETDLCIRVRQAYPGAELLYVPAARVRHQVPAERTTLRYFLTRCYSEGLSKARLARLVGAQQGLESERAYTLHTLPRGLVRGLADAFGRGDLGGLRRAAAIGLGLGLAVAGHGAGQFLPAPRVPALPGQWEPEL